MEGREERKMGRSTRRGRKIIIENSASKSCGTISNGLTKYVIANPEGKNDRSRINIWRDKSWGTSKSNKTTENHRPKKFKVKKNKHTYIHKPSHNQFSSVQSLSHVWLFATPWTAACQASLSITNSRSLPKPMSTESVMPSSHLILCRPLLLLLSIFSNIRVVSNESPLRIRRPKYWSFSFNIIPSNKHQGWFPLGWTGWISLQSMGLSRVFSNTTVQKHQFFGAQLSL